MIGIHSAQNHRQTDLWSQILCAAQDIRLIRRFHVGISVCATNIRIHNQGLWNWYITGNIFSLFNVPKWKRSLKECDSVTISSFRLLFGFKNCAQDFDMYEAPCGLSVVIFRDLLVVGKQWSVGTKRHRAFLHKTSYVHKRTLFGLLAFWYKRHIGSKSCEWGLSSVPVRRSWIFNLRCKTEREKALFQQTLKCI